MSRRRIHPARENGCSAFGASVERRLEARRAKRAALEDEQARVEVRRVAARERVERLDRRVEEVGQRLVRDRQLAQDLDHVRAAVEAAEVAPEPGICIARVELLERVERVLARAGLAI